MERIRWTDKVVNQGVLEEYDKCPNTVLRRIMSGKKSLLETKMREDYLFKWVVQGKILISILSRDKGRETWVIQNHQRKALNQRVVLSNSHSFKFYEN